MTIIFDTTYRILDVKNSQARLLPNINPNELIDQTLDEISYDKKLNHNFLHIVENQVADELRKYQYSCYEYTISNDDNVRTQVLCLFEQAEDGKIYEYIIPLRNDIDSIKCDDIHIQVSDVKTGFVVRLFKTDGTNEYIYQSDVIKNITKTEDIRETESWNQTQEDEADNDVLQSGESLKCDWNVEVDNCQLEFECTKIRFIGEIGNSFVITQIANLLSNEECEIKGCQPNKLQEDIDYLQEAMNIGQVSAWIYDITAGVFKYMINHKWSNKDIFTREETKLSIHPDDYLMFLGILENIKNKKIVRDECQVRLLSQEEKEYSYYKVNYVVKNDENGEPAVIIGTLHDISKEKQLQADIELSYASFDIMSESPKFMTWEYDLRTHMHRVIYGKRFDETHPEFFDYINYSHNIHPDDFGYAMNLIKELINKKRERCSITVRLKDSANLYNFLEINVIANLDENGEVLSLIGSTYDISDQQNRLERLHDLESDLDASLNVGQMNIWEYDVQNDWIRIVRGKPILVLNSRMSDFYATIYPEYYGNAVSQLNNVINDKAEEAEFVTKNKSNINGADCYIYYSFKSKKIGGKVIKLVGICQNVTQLYIQKAQLEKSQAELNYSLSIGGLSSWLYNAALKIFKPLSGEILKLGIKSSEDIYKKLYHKDAVLLRGLLDDIIYGRKTEACCILRFVNNGELNKYNYFECHMTRKVENGVVVGVIGIHKNVTDSYSRQIELEEYRRKNELIHSACNIVQWEYDPERRIINTYTDDAILPNIDIDFNTYLKFVHPDDREMITREFNHINNDLPDSIDIESLRLRLPNSEGFHQAVLNAIPIKDEDGNIIRYSGIRRDISEFVNLNERLLEREKMLDLIINNIHVALIYFDNNCRIKWSNIESHMDFVKKCGIKRFRCGEFCDMMQDNGQCAVPKFGRNHIDNLKDKICFDELNINGVIVKRTTVPILHDGKRDGFMVMFEDITERKKLMNDIREAEERTKDTNHILNTIIDRIPNAIFIKDPSDDFRYILVNKMYQDAICDRKESIIGKRDADFMVDKDFVARHRMYDQIVMEQDNIIMYDDDIYIKSLNEMKHTQIRKMKVKFPDGKLYIIGTVTDITDIHNINEELIKQRAKAEESDRLKSAFLANMSHEIRTPLNSIIGFSDLLADADNEDDKKTFCRIINDNNELLLSIINNILVLSKIEAGFNRYNRSEVDLVELFNDFVASFKHNISNPNVKFIVDNPYKVCDVIIDKEKFKQVITNYISNAIKYTKVGHIKVGYSYDDSKLRFYVEDTGIGIPMSQQNIVFQRFEKLGSMLQGTGLGLSIVKAIVENDADGQVGVDSVEGQGSTFWAIKNVKCTALVN